MTTQPLEGLPVALLLFLLTYLPKLEYDPNFGALVRAKVSRARTDTALSVCPFLPLPQPHSFLTSLTTSLSPPPVSLSQASYLIDGVPLVAGVACLLHQVHPAATRKLLAYLGQYVRTRVQVTPRHPQSVAPILSYPI